MTGPIERLRDRLHTEAEALDISRRNMKSIPMVMARAENIGGAQGMPREFKETDPETSVNAEATVADLMLYNKIRKLVVRHQLQEKIDSATIVGIGYNATNQVADAWTDRFPDLHGAEGLRGKTDQELWYPHLHSDVLRKIRSLYPYSPLQTEPPEEGKVAIEDTTIPELISQVQTAREKGYHGVANVLTVAWVLAEQQRHEQLPEHVDVEKLLKSVRRELLSSQLMNAKISGRYLGPLMRGIDGIMPPVFDIQDLKMVPNEALLGIFHFGGGGLHTIRAALRDLEN